MTGHHARRHPVQYTGRRHHQSGASIDDVRKDYNPGRATAEAAEREREVAEQVEAIRAEARRRRDEGGAS